MYCISDSKRAKKEYKFDDYSLNRANQIYDIYIRIGDKEVFINIDYGKSEMAVKVPEDFSPMEDLDKNFLKNLIVDDPKISKNMKDNFVVIYRENK